MLCWSHIFAAFCFLYLVINSDDETGSATTEYSECRLALSYWEIGPPPPSFAGWMDVTARNSANSSLWIVWLSQEQVLLLFVLSHPGWREGNCMLKPVFDERSSIYDS